MIKWKCNNVNSAFIFSIFSKEEKRKSTMQDATPKHAPTEWVLCSDNWQDIVIIIYIPQLNDIPIEDNYVDISLKEIKDAYSKNFSPLNWKRTHGK